MECVEACLKADDHEYQEADGNSCCKTRYIDDGIISVPGQSPENVDEVVPDHTAVISWGEWLAGCRVPKECHFHNIL
jgi:hypothetical protein